MADGPELIYLPNANSPRAIIQAQSSGINFFSSDYPLEDWAGLVVHEEFEFDYIVDFKELVEDKSLAPMKSEILLYQAHLIKAQLIEDYSLNFTNFI